MPTVLEFFFDYGSPFSYLADTQLPALAERTGAEAEGVGSLQAVRATGCRLTA
jgi:2-hydroxychromene-2-carboxylate isomerase